MPDPSPTLAAMASRFSPRLRFDCDPCNRTRFYEPADLIASVGGDVTLNELKARIVCRGCGKHVDGEMRRLEFLCATTADGFGTHGV